MTALAFGILLVFGVGISKAFKTIRPVPYSGRTPHLHVRVRPAGGQPLTTQIYIAGDSIDGDFVLDHCCMPIDGRHVGGLVPPSESPQPS